ncbi:MAG: hypothetical protein EPN97_08155 [Alphaproteobacteria bacterium]|nr:MAG: hypothetical protein EPN97_08155 [Alphaproteobacteria bacterium]
MLQKTKAIIISIGIFCLALPVLPGCSSRPENVGTSAQEVDPEDWKAENKKAEKRIVLAREAFHDGKIVNRPPDPPLGMRPGAYSRSFESGMHWEVPQKFNCIYCGNGSLAAYENMHHNNRDIYRPMGWFHDYKATADIYYGDGYLPAGSWTGRPLEPAKTRELSWKQDAQGRVRSDEVSGAPLKITPAPNR